LGIFSRKSLMLPKTTQGVPRGHVPSLAGGGAPAKKGPFLQERLQEMNLWIALPQAVQAGINQGRLSRWSDVASSLRAVMRPDDASRELEQAALGLRLLLAAQPGSRTQVPHRRSLLDFLLSVYPGSEHDAIEQRAASCLTRAGLGAACLLEMDIADHGGPLLQALCRLHPSSRQEVASQPAIHGAFSRAERVLIERELHRFAACHGSLALDLLQVLARFSESDRRFFAREPLIQAVFQAGATVAQVSDRAQDFFQRLACSNVSPLTLRRCLQGLARMTVSSHGVQLRGWIFSYLGDREAQQASIRMKSLLLCHHLEAVACPAASRGVALSWEVLGTAVTGTGVSEGPGRWVTGPACFDPTKIRTGEILVRTRTNPQEDLQALKIAGGVVTTGGGILSHAAIHAREEKIHAVILGTAKIEERPGQGLCLVIPLGQEGITVRAGNLIRVSVHQEEGTVYVFPEAQTPLSQAQFCLEELLWGCQGHAEASTRLQTFLDQGQIDATALGAEASVMLASALAACEEILRNERLAIRLKHERLCELLASVERLKPFLSAEQGDSSQAELEAGLEDLRDQEPERDAADIQLEERVAKVLEMEPGSISLMELRRLRRRLDPQSALYVPLRSREDTLQDARTAEILASGQLFFRREEVDEDFAPLLGPKFARLGDLRMLVDFQARVPPGSAFGQQVFERFLGASRIREKFVGLQARITEALQDTQLDENRRDARLQTLCQAMRTLIQDARVDDMFFLEDTLGLRHDFLPDPPYAFRGTGPEDREEGAAAGLTSTDLNIDLEGGEIMPHVQAVWASYWNTAAVTYRFEHYQQADAPQLAVGIESMIEGDVSGVLMSRHPLSGEAVVTITASYGLCAGVVDGRVASDHYSLGLDGRVQQRVVHKAEKIICASNGGTEIDSVPSPLDQKACLDEAQVRDLAALARRLEEHFGFAVDVEWTIRDGEIWILQVRPITGGRALFEAVSAADKALKLMRAFDRIRLYFVCSGNRHRSASMHLAMEAVLAHVNLDEDVQVQSGGLAARDWDQSLDHDIVLLARELGTPMTAIDEFYIQSVPDDFEEGSEPTLVIVAEEGMKRDFADRFPDLAGRVFCFNELCPTAFPGSDLDIDDPYDQEQRAAVFKGIHRGIQADLWPLIHEVLVAKNIAEKLAEDRVEDEVGDEKGHPEVTGDEILRQYPAVSEALDRFGWDGAERAKLIRVMDRLDIYSRVHDSLAESLMALSYALEELAEETGWDHRRQRLVLAFIIEAYRDEVHQVLEDLSAALLGKIDWVMGTQALRRSDKHAVLTYCKEFCTPAQLRTAAQFFWKRRRFFALSLLKGHFGIEFPIDELIAKTLLGELRQEGNAQTAADLAALVCTPFDSGSEELALAEQERRAARSPRSLNQERKVVFDEISEFYLIQAIKKDLEGLACYALTNEQETRIRMMQDDFAGREARVFGWLREYLLFAVAGELCHQEEEGAVFVPGGHVAPFFTDARELGLTIPDFVRLATEEEIRLFLYQAERRFSPNEWPENAIVGGGRWQVIADLALKLWQAKGPDNQLIDLAFHLEHNGAMAFDKDPSHLVQGSRDTLLLDLRESAHRTFSLWMTISEYLSDSTRRRIGAWIRNLQVLQGALMP
jgi:protein-tyrosine-phosphatase/phosphohistidine swiveling domain-containing protein